MRYVYLLLPLLLVLVGCERREEHYDYSATTVDIKFNWDGVTQKLPATMRVLFYPKDEDGRRFETYLPSEGGEIKVSPGHYAVAIYNYNTESVLIRGDENYETIEAYTGQCTGFTAAGEMVWSPDALYVVALEDVKIEKSDAPIQMELKPEHAVRCYSFEIKVKGLDNVADVLCTIKGLDGSFFMGMNSCKTSCLPIYVEMQKGNDVLKGSFSCFAMTKRNYSVSTVTRVDGGVMMNLKLIKLDKTVQEIQVDVTNVVVPPSAGGDLEPPEAGGGEIEIDIPLEEEIVVEDVPSAGGGGGIGGDVGDWGDEDNIELPI